MLQGPCNNFVLNYWTWKMTAKQFKFTTTINRHEHKHENESDLTFV